MRAHGSTYAAPPAPAPRGAPTAASWYSCSVGHAVKVRGRFSDPRHIELEEPVNDLTGPVDVVVQEAERPAVTTTPRGFIGLCADLGTAPTAEDIDDGRRKMWAGFPRDDV